ncbi:MAG: recombinase family protein [Eubacterium sp.]|nr:recombinase family protein [Eubacterium sp.]
MKTEKGGNNADGRITALYVRVSTGHQIDRDSLPFQKKELQNYCLHILHIPADELEVFEDAGKSGKNTDRPAFQRMMKKVKAGGVARVCVYKIDRISRNLVDFSLMYDDFKANRTTFISLNEQFDTSSAIGEAILKIILVFAELERKLASERVMDVMIGRAQDGKWNGAHMPFGWKWNAETQLPEHDPDEAEKARMLYRLYDETRSTSKVRDFCYANNIQTKRGGKWTTGTIINFLKNPMNKGDYRYNYRYASHGARKPDNEVVYLPAVFPPLVSPELWDRVNAVIKENGITSRTSFNPHQKRHAHVFSGGILRCAECGATFQVFRLDSVRLNGFRPSLYLCSSRRRFGSCNASGASDVVIGPFVFNFVSNLAAVSAARRDYVKAGIGETEKRLLQGDAFSCVLQMDAVSLRQIFDALRGISRAGSSFIPSPLENKKDDRTAAIDQKRKEVVKINRALERLKKAYLFDDDVMDEREYITTRSRLEEDMARISNEIASEEESVFESMSELSFITSATEFLLSYQIQSGAPIVYSDFAPVVGNETLHKFVQTIIERIEVRRSHVSAIVFKNGLDVRFILKDA